MKLPFKMIGSNRIVKKEIELINWDAKVTRGGKKNFGKFQYDVKQLLRPHWKNHICAEEFKIPARVSERGRSLDLVNFTTRQVCEIQGNQHDKLSWCHKNKFQFFKQLQRDEFKEKWCKLNGFELFEIYESDELNEDLLIKLGMVSLNI